MMGVPWPDTSLPRSRWVSADGPRLLAVASALQLLPQNAGFLLPLGRLAGAAATVPARPNSPAFSSSLVRSLLSLDGVGGEGVQRMQDPYEGLFVIEVPFYGRARLVVQGQSTHAGKHLDALLTALFRAPGGTFPREFVGRARTLTALLLDVSDTVCHRAGLTRLTAAADSHDVVHVPGAAKLSAMANWVTITVDEVFGHLSEPARAYLEPLPIREQGAAAPRDLDEWLTIKPFVRSGSSLVIAAPTELAASLRHHLIADAYESGCAEELARQLLILSADRVSDLVARGGQREVGDGWVRLTRPLDEDKTLDVLVIADDLQHFDTGSPYGQWYAQDVVDAACSAAATDAGGRRLPMIVRQDMGRDFIANVPDSIGGAGLLLLSTEDLETILQTPRTDGLSLWYFEQELSRLHEQASVYAFSATDLWSVFVDRHWSFYLSDDEFAGAVMVDRGSGQELRVSNARRLDRRHVIHPRTRSVCESYSMHGPDSSPVYMVIGSGGASFFVDLDGVEAWVHLTGPRDAIRSAGRGLQPAGEGLFDIGEAVAYWLSELYASNPELVEAAAPQRTLEVDVRMSDASDDAGTWVRVGIGDEGPLLEVLDAPVVPDDPAPNAADRVLVSALLQAIGSAPVPAIVDRVAPVGPKRMIHTFGSDEHALAWPGRLKSVWHLNESAVAQVLDDLGDHLVNERGMVPGPIPMDRRTAVLNGVVTRWLIDELSSLLAALNGDHLLLKLIDRHEALVSADARESVHLPARIACFGADSDEVERIRRNQGSAASAMLANRFLIEYASAFPPAGTQPLTHEMYNHAMALASEVVNKGMLSDSIQHGLSNVELSLLDSRRFGIDNDDDRFASALDGFTRTRAQAVFEKAGADETGPTTRARFDMREADELAKLEFGFSYSELGRALRAVLDVMNETSYADVLEMRLDELQGEVATRLEWDDHRAAQLLSRLTLRPSEGTIDEFWGQGVSVRPWRFSRERSFLRRPFVLSHDGPDAIVTFGRRSLWHTLPYWTHQFTSGRLQAETNEMRSALSRRTRVKGDEYERRIADGLEDLGYTNVRRRLRKVGPHDFRNIDGKDLGDIDVAAVHLHRREVLLLEVKDLEVARTPAELANEVKNLAGEGNSAIRRLKQRRDWVTQHLALTLHELAVGDASGQWTIRPLVVVNEPLMSEHFIASDIPILSHTALRSHLGS